MEFNETNLQVIIAMITSMFVASIAIPTIVTVARKKGLVSAPNGRSSHKREIPILGGLALYLGVGISTCMWTEAVGFSELNGIFGASLILMAIGLKDDILIIDPYKKFVGEIMAALLLVLFAGIKLTSFHGTVVVIDLGNAFSIASSVFVIILIINAFNLSDGIDGLAAGIGILASTVYGYWFFQVGEISFAILSLSLLGALLGFSYFNVLGSRNKIFMGDTGALLVGMILAILSIKFCELNLTDTSTYQMSSAPAIAIAILSISLFDTLRVFTLRIFRRKSPFRAEKNHIHHILLDLNFSHLESTLILLSLNAILIFLSITFRSISTLLLISLLFLTFLLFCKIVFTLRKKGVVVRPGQIDINETKFGMALSGNRTQKEQDPSSIDQSEKSATKKKMRNKNL